MTGNEKGIQASMAVEQALQMVEEAQRTLSKAAATICDVAYLGKEWSRIGKVSDDAREAWYSLKRTAEKVGASGKLEMVH